MKRFIQVILQTHDGISEGEQADFENRCSCAIACGYIPCGNTLQMNPVITGEGDGNISSNEDGNIHGSFDLDIKTDSRKYCMVQSFYDQEGNATHICGHCAKCETCDIAPESDIYCKKFQDTCYQEEEE